MNYELKIQKPDEIKETLISFFRNRSLIPIVGSGFSCGLSANKGKVPNGYDYKEHMLEKLCENSQFTVEEKNIIKEQNFSNICDYYEDDDNVSSQERFQYLKQNFYQVFMKDDIRSKFLDIEWPYIYSLNLDDAIENSSLYKTKILPNREYREEIFREAKCLIKLHGDIQDIVTYKDGSKIFSSKEYALSLENNSPLLNKLKNDYLYQNILFVGCSLDDEIDLKSLSSMPINFKLKENLSKTIIFVKGMPGKLQQSKYKIYGITDIVYFDDYDSIYNFLKTTWLEAQKIQLDEIYNYSNIKLNKLNVLQKKENKDYFYWGKGLFDSKLKTVTYPYFFISRNISSKIINNISKNKVHLISGRRMTGKSYLIADLYQTIRDREVYYFDGKSRLSKFSLEKLINLKNAVVLLDIGSLNRDQFEYVLISAKKINKNSSNFVINVNINDGDTLGIVKWKLKQKIIQSTDIISYNISNKLCEGKNDEIEKINKLLPSVNLPPYSANRNILDQLIYAEKELKTKGRFKKQSVIINNIKQLALLIVLAIREKLFSSEVVNFGFEQEIFEALNRYSPFIERVDSFDFEKDATDLSRIKYILNSKYWLRRELGDYARLEKNHKTISEAYKYIIRKVIECSGNNEFRQRKICRDYILFDVINDVFLDEYSGNMKLIVNLYTQLHELLATDHNFLHQNAKCYLNYTYSVKGNDKKREYLLKARELAVVAKSMMEQRYEKSHNERLLISVAHTQYTIATIQSDLCKFNKYLDIKEIENTIDAVNEAIISPYNSDDYRNDRYKRNSRGIVNFLKYCLGNTNNLAISNSYLQKLTNLMNTFYT